MVKPGAKVVMSEQLLDRSRRDEESWGELLWIAIHYDECSPEEQARFDEFEKRFNESKDLDE